MKNKFARLISFVLTVAMLISCFSVLSFAQTTDADDGTEEEKKTGTVVYNRNYEEGWGVYNGFGNETTMKEHNFYIDYETTVDYNYNYFVRYEATAESSELAAAGKGEGDGFTELNFEKAGNPSKNKVYVEFDLKADDYINLATGTSTSILYARYVGGASKNSPFNLLGIGENELWLFNKKDVTIPLVDEWVHITIEFDYTDEDLVKQQSSSMITITADNGEESVTQTNLVASGTAGYVGLNILRFGYVKDVSTARAGMSFCLDNLVAYYNCTEPMTEEEIAAQGLGMLIDQSLIKTETILGKGDEASLGDVLDDALAMKLGVNYTLVKGEKKNIYDGTYGAPTKVADNIIVPLELLLDYVGFEYYIHEDGKSYDISTGSSASYITIGREIATVDGEMVYLSMAPAYYTDPETSNSYPVVAMADIETLLPGYFVTYDEMGLIIICKAKDVLNRKDHLSLMLDIMKDFIFDFVDAQTIYNDVVENSDNFTHPYLLADQDRFDRLIAIYNGTDTKEYDIDLKRYITAQVDRAYNLYEIFALPSHNVSEIPMIDSHGDYLYDEKTGAQRMKVIGDHNEWVGLDWNDSNVLRLRQPYEDMGGYDIGGRLGDAGSLLNYAYDLAFGYIITGEIKLAQCAYAIMVEVGEWDHWGPGHFLNVSEAATPYSIALDWIYNGIVKLENGEIDVNEDDVTSYSVAYLEELLYKNGVHMGYIATMGEPCPWPRPARLGGNVYLYTTMTNNWNAVCTSGMWLGSLMLLGNESYKDEAASLISMNIESLARYGMDQYAPDGSYVESPGYWGYGTNYMLHGLMGLWNAAGSDYGLMDCWGMDKTFYFACLVESSDYEMFNYHDGSEGQMVDSISFFFAAEVLDDPALAEIRKIHINNGKGCNIRDMLFYPLDEEDSDVDIELPLDYYMEGIDGYTTRSSWESGAIFAGIIGGDNAASHGQIDSGDFVYHQAGVKWITDLGSEEYNVYNYFTTPDRYRYYRSNAEGNNVLSIISQPQDVPYGQKTTGFGEVISHGNNEYGSYVTIDNTDVYGGYTVSAIRGMLFTNDRKTLVIQDEVSLLGADQLLWSAHFNSSQIQYRLSEDARTLYLYTADSKGRELQKVRLSIVSQKETETFSVTSCYDFELVGELGTVVPEYTLAMGGVAEKSRDDYSRINIKSNGISFNLAVVIEPMDVDSLEEPEVGYDLVPMSSWQPAADNRGETPDDPDDPDGEKIFRGPAKLKNITSGVTKLTGYSNLGYSYIDRIIDYYYTLTEIEFTIRSFDADQLSKYKDQCDSYVIFKQSYNSFAQAIIGNIDQKNAIVTSLLGF